MFLKLTGSPWFCRAMWPVGELANCGQALNLLAAILAFAMLIPVFSAGLLQSLSNDPGKKDTLGYFNLWDHMEEFSRGVVDTRRIVYYLSATAFFLFLTTVMLSTKKENP